MHFPDGELVARVRPEPDCPFAEDPATGSFVRGSFTPGPASPRLRARLEAFFDVFASGSTDQASQLHDDIDGLGLVATDRAGQRYRVRNVYFQEGGLLFNADPIGAA